MKYTYTGPGKGITLRGVKFAKDTPVDLSKKPELALKVSALSYFEKHAEPAA